jgi:hypothetical protein
MHDTKTDILYYVFLKLLETRRTTSEMIEKKKEAINHCSTVLGE